MDEKSIEVTTNMDNELSSDSSSEDLPSTSTTTSQTAGIINHGELKVKRFLFKYYQAAKSRKITLLPIQFNYQDPIESFIGRGKILTQLHTTVQNNAKSDKLTVLSQAQIITGIGGLGKTETIRMYVNKYKNHYTHILWINSETFTDAQSCFNRIAQSCEIPTDNFDSKMPQILEEIYDKLCFEPTLIVFDNAEALGEAQSNQEIRPFFPKTIKVGWKNPAIIATSRNRDWRDAALIELDGFNSKECFILLQTQLQLEDNSGNRDAASKITVLCDGLPLVVQQVITIVRDKTDELLCRGESPYTIQQFLMDFNENQMDAKPADSPIGKSTSEIFNLSFERIMKKEDGHLAMKLLCIMSLLSPDNIPSSLLFLLTDEDQTECSRALSLLNKQNLITRCDGGDFKIHRVVQFVAFNAMKTRENSFDDIFRAFVPKFTCYLQTKLLAQDFFKIYLNGLKLASHLLKYTHLLESREFVMELARSLSNYGKHSDSQYLFERMLPVYEGNDDNIYLVHTIKFNLAWAQRKLGKYSEALQMFKQLLQQQKRQLHPYHEHVLRTKLAIADTYEEIGEFQRAIEIYSKISKHEENCCGKFALSTLEVKFRLARAYKSLGNYVKSIKLHRKVIRILTEELQPENEEVISAKHNLAVVLIQNNSFDEAIDLLTEIMGIQISSIGPQHPNTLSTKYNLSNALRGIKKYEDALELSREVLQARVNIFGPKHISTLASKNTVSMILMGMERYDEAVTTLEATLVDVISILGEDHPDTLSTLYNLGIALNHQGNTKLQWRFFKWFWKSERKFWVNPIQFPFTQETEKRLQNLLEKLTLNSSP